MNNIKNLWDLLPNEIQEHIESFSQIITYYECGYIKTWQSNNIIYRINELPFILKKQPLN
jgi:hypothetical protein